MVPSGPSNQGNGELPVGPSLLHINSGLLSSGQPVLSGSPLPRQSQFLPSLPPQMQFSGNGLLSGAVNVAALYNRPFANGGSITSSNFGMGALLRGRLESSASDLVGSVQADPFVPEGQHLLNSLSKSMQETQFQQQSGMPQQRHDMHGVSQQHHDMHGVPQQPQLWPVKLENGRGMGVVTLEQQMGLGIQNGPGQMMCDASPVKIETRQFHMTSNSGQVKMEMPPSDPNFLQQQQILQLTKQTAQANQAAQLSLLQQQRLLQLQQQQQALKNMPVQHNQLQQQQQQQQMLLRQQSLLAKAPAKSSSYEPGTCSKRLTHYMHHQQSRPQDNNIEYWRNFVANYYSPNAKKRWCVSLYGSGRQSVALFPQDVWQCEICNYKPGRGFETSAEVLPRLFQMKYASGTLEELLYVDMPHETQNASGQIVLDYDKAIQESVYEQLRVVREGHLRVVFNPDLKIASWVFCARHHEEFIPRRSIIPQVSQLGAVVQKYQTVVQNSACSSSQDLQNTCNSFVASARQLAKSLEVPLVNDLGYTKRYVRCLQIAEVVNSMKDLIDYSTQNRIGPKESLSSFPRRAANSIVTHSGVNGSHSVTPSTSASSAPDPTLRQGSFKLQQEQQMYSADNLYNTGGNYYHPSIGSSANLLPQLHSVPSPSVSLAIQSPSNNNMLQSSLHSSQITSPGVSSNMSTVQPPAARPLDSELSESQSSVQRILQEVVSSHTRQCNGAKRRNGMSAGDDGSSQSMAGLCPTPTISVALNDGVHDMVLLNRFHQQHQQQGIGNLYLPGATGVESSGFDSLRRDWKSLQ